MSPMIDRKCARGAGEEVAGTGARKIEGRAVFDASVMGAVFAQTFVMLKTGPVGENWKKLRELEEEVA